MKKLKPCSWSQLESGDEISVKVGTDVLDYIVRTGWNGSYVVISSVEDGRKGRMFVDIVGGSSNVILFGRWGYAPVTPSWTQMDVLDRISSGIEGWRLVDIRGRCCLRKYGEKDKAVSMVTVNAMVAGGWVKAESRSRGVVRYKITESGEKALENI